MKIITKTTWFSIIIFSLFGQVAWTIENMVLNQFIAESFNASSFHIALMVSLSAIVATLTTLFMGALSDKLGKRKIFICAGYIAWGIIIIAFALLRKDILSKVFPYADALMLGILLVILFDCIMSFFGSTANDACFNSWVTDITDDNNRGKVEGVNSAMPLLSVLVVYGLMMFLDWSGLFTVLGILVLIAGILGFFILEESDIKGKPNESYFKNIFHGFKPSVIKNNKTLYLIYIAFAIYCISNQVFMPYYVIYLQQKIGDSYVFVMAPAIILAALCTIIFGRLLDKYKFKKAFIPVFALYLIGLLMLFIFTDSTPLIFIGCTLMLSGFLSVTACYQASMREYTPEENVGLFQGVRMFIQVLLPMLIGPWIGAVLSGGGASIGGVTGEGFVASEKIYLGGIIVALIHIIPLILVYKNIKPKYNKLTTNYEEQLDENIPYPDYPRPQFRRDSFINLNGKWEYKISDSSDIPSVYDGEILVPFCLESRLSKVEKRLKEGQSLFYKRKFSLPEGFVKDKVVLHFQAVDQVCWVYLNGTEVGHNENGYLPFEIDITKYLKPENELIVKVIDNLDILYPYGKQVRKPKGMWYTPVSGIWQTVWLESVNDNFIESIVINTNIDENKLILDIESNSHMFNIDILYNGEVIKSLTNCNNHNEIVFDEIKLWSPEEPNLYDIIISNDNDKVESYFGFRKIHIKDEKIYLNNKPYFFNGVLDQGYYPDGIFLPATKQGFIDDILQMKRLGFNTLRKHIKIEPLEFYYQCDKLGMLVFQDMINNGEYHYIGQTVLPTIGFKKYTDTKKPIEHKYYRKFKECSINYINHLYNIISIVYWTIYNEGWGQTHSDDMYNIVKELDSTRIIDSTSGWFHQSHSDVLSEHVYFKPVKYNKINKPTIISEFGGYSYKLDDHSYNLSNTYGYATCRSQEDFEQSLIKLYENEILPHINDGLCGAIYTQLSDVEDETNGFVTYDRKVLKVDENKISELFKNINK